MYFKHAPTPHTDDAAQSSSHSASVSARSGTDHLAVLDELPHMVWMRQDGQPHGNLAWREYTGGHVPQDWLELVHPEDQAAARQQWQQSVQAQKTFEAQLRLRRHDEHYRWVLALCRHPS